MPGRRQSRSGRGGGLLFHEDATRRARHGNNSNNTRGIGSSFASANTAIEHTRILENLRISILFLSHLCFEEFEINRISTALLGSSETVLIPQLILNNLSFLFSLKLFLKSIFVKSFNHAYFKIHRSLLIFPNTTDLCYFNLLMSLS